MSDDPWFYPIVDEVVDHHPVAHVDWLLHAQDPQHIIMDEY
jgi:hypothetical protein